MEDVIFNLKGVVLLILISEFMKNLLVTDKFKKYISFAISIFVLGFLISTISGTVFTFDNSYNFNYDETNSAENQVSVLYKNKIIAEITSKLNEKGIEVIDIEVIVSDDYNLEKLAVKVNGNLEKADAVLKGIGFLDYELYT